MEVKTLGLTACVLGLDEPVSWLSEGHTHPVLNFLMVDPVGEGGGCQKKDEVLMPLDREAHSDISHTLFSRLLLFLINTVSQHVSWAAWWLHFATSAQHLGFMSDGHQSVLADKRPLCDSEEGASGLEGEVICWEVDRKCTPSALILGAWEEPI